MQVTAYNPSTDNLEKTYLSKSYAVGQAAFATRNTNMFIPNSMIMIGEMGSENTEILIVQSIGTDNTTINTVSGCLFPHTASDPVYLLKYDQIKFYRSTSGINGTYTELAVVPIDVDNQNLKTQYNDTTGLTNYFYKISFYNSAQTAESSLSDPIPGTGYSKKQVGSLVQEFFTEIGDFSQDYITVNQVVALLNECNEDIIGQSRRPYRFLRKKVPFSLTNGSNSVDLPTVAPDLIRFDRLKYQRIDNAGNSVSGNIAMIPTEEFEYRIYNQNTLVQMPLGIGIQYATLDETDNKIFVYPIPTSNQPAAGYIYYWGDFDYIKGLGDTLQTPVKRIYKMFLLGRYYRMRAKKETSFLTISDRYMSDYNTEVVKLQRAQKVDIGTKKSFLPDVRTAHGLRRRV